MKNIIARLKNCFYLFLIVSVVSLTTNQTALGSNTGSNATAPEQQENGLTFVEKQELSEGELNSLSETENVDQITAGHGHGRGPVPGRIFANDILFWAGFSLIMLSFAVYPY